MADLVEIPNEGRSRVSGVRLSSGWAAIAFAMIIYVLTFSWYLSSKITALEERVSALQSQVLQLQFDLKK